jgi:hypothetical protein
VRASALGRTFISTAFYERLLRVENVYPLCGSFFVAAKCFLPTTSTLSKPVAH